jgi:hypothetical protein
LGSNSLEKVRVKAVPFGWGLTKQKPVAAGFYAFYLMVSILKLGVQTQQALADNGRV